MNDFFDHNLRHPLPQQSPHQPLTEAQCDELFKLFDNASLPAAAMSAEMADGYLTACVVGPASVPAHEFMEAIFGQPTLPICADPGHQHRLLQLLLHRCRDIDTATSLAPEDMTIDNLFAPLRGEVPANEIISPYQLDGQGNRKGNWSGKDWAEGFRRAMLADPLWDDLAYDPESSLLLAPVMLYQQGFNPDKPKLQLEQEKNLFPMLVICISKIREFWSVGPDDLLAFFVRKACKVGRNDPCPCGSGKKYKKTLRRLIDADTRLAQPRPGFHHRRPRAPPAARRSVPPWQRHGQLADPGRQPRSQQGAAAVLPGVGQMHLHRPPYNTKSAFEHDDNTPCCDALEAGPGNSTLYWHVANIRQA